jgi:hypothetical protein
MINYHLTLHIAIIFTCFQTSLIICSTNWLKFEEMQKHSQVFTGAKQESTTALQ